LLLQVELVLANIDLFMLHKQIFRLQVVFWSLARRPERVQISKLIMSDFGINFEDFPDAARIQDLIALLVHSKRKFVDFALDRIK